MKIVFTLFLLFTLSFSSISQTTSNPILFIYDASGSMWGQLDGKTKKEIASSVLSDAVVNLPEGQSIGLIAYGHRREKDCSDVEWMVDLDNQSKEQITSKVKAINPLGRTPLARSATMAIDKLRSSKAKATIILVTDGIESCDGDICDVIKAAKEEGIDFKLHIVGFGLKEGETAQLECAAQAGEGNYYDAKDAAGLSEVLNEAIIETVDDLPGNFSIYAVKNGQPVDVWVKAFPKGSDKEIDMSRSYRDSAWIHLPPGIYNIEILPLENTDLSGRTIEVIKKEGNPGHINVSFDAAKAKVMVTNNNEGWDAIVKFYDNKSGKHVAQVRTYGREQILEVDPGTYNVSMSALIQKGMLKDHQIENITINGGKSQSLSHNFDSGKASIGVVTSSGELVDATVRIYDKRSGKSVGAGRTYTSASSNPREFILYPGTFNVNIITLGAHKGHSESFDIEVIKGDTVSKSINIE